MKRFGFAIRTGGDPEISRALAEGIERATSSGAARHLPLKGKAFGEAQGKAFGEHCSEAVRRVAMMRHTPQEWAQMTEDARLFYGGQRYAPRWAERLLLGWALVCMGMSWLYHLQDRLLDRRAI